MMSKWGERVFKVILARGPLPKKMILGRELLVIREEIFVIFNAGLVIDGNDVALVV